MQALLKLFGGSLVSKIITGLVAVGIVAGGVINYQVFNQYKKIEYKIADVQLKGGDWKGADFQITMDIDNPITKIRLSNLNTVFFLENIRFADYDTTQLVLNKGHNRVVFESVRLDYKGFGKGSLESLTRAWNSIDNTAHFGYQADFKIGNPWGLPGTWIADLAGLNKRLEDQIPFEVPGLRTTKVIANYTVMFWDKSADFRKQVYEVVVSTVEKVQSSPKVQAIIESGKADLGTLVIVGGSKVAEFMNSRNVQRLVETFHLDDKQFVDVYQKAQGLFDRAINMAISTWISLNS